MLLSFHSNFNVFSNIDNPLSHASQLIFNGGNNLIFVFAESTKSPFFIKVSITGCMSMSNAIPNIMPKPSTFITWGISLIFCFKYAPFLLTSCKNASSMVSNITFAPAQTTGLPPNVEPWSPFCKISFVFSPNSIAPMGKPPPKPLAQDTKSGCISYC